MSAFRGEGRGDEFCGRLRTFDGRVVLVDEVALDELDGQATLTNTTATNNYKLVFPEELQGPRSANGAGWEG